jgi:hypothetical protein
LKLHAKNISIGEAGDEYFQVSFDSEVPSDDDFALSGPITLTLSFSVSSRMMTAASATSRPTIATPTLATSG